MTKKTESVHVFSDYGTPAIVEVNSKKDRAMVEFDLDSPYLSSTGKVYLRQSVRLTTTDVAHDKQPLAIAVNAMHKNTQHVKD